MVDSAAASSTVSSSAPTVSSLGAAGGDALGQGGGVAHAVGHRDAEQVVAREVEARQRALELGLQRDEAAVPSLVLRDGAGPAAHHSRPRLAPAPPRAGARSLAGRAR